MKRLLSTTAMAVILASGTVGAAFAQEYGTEGVPTTTNQEPLDRTEVVWTKAEGEWRSDDLIGAEVVNDSDEPLGQVEMLLVSLETDAAPARSPDTAQPAEGGDDAAAAGEAPLGEEPLPAGEESAAEAQPEAAAPLEGETAAGDAIESGDAASSPETAKGGGESVMAPSQASIYSAQITDVVIGIGGFLGIGGKRIAVPLEEFMFFTGDNGEHKVVLSATAEELEALPEFVDRDDAVPQGSPEAPALPQ